LTFQPTLQALGAAFAVICATAPAAAAQVERRIDIAGGAMATALAECAREMRVELVFDARLVAGKRALRLRGRFTPDAALGRLLSGSGLGFRRASGGAFVVYALAAADPLPPEQAVPEILVIGRRTQNTDIRRTRDDIQPYRVLTRRDIERSHRDDVEQLIRSREPLNVQPISPSQEIASADTRSSFDFRGLGALRSLVLVDGRRMPSFPTAEFDFGQPDINGIPLAAIERIETRTGTAGGIYGPNALGGVLNVVLRRDYDGVELRATSGISSRGDSGTVGVDGRAGFTFNKDRTSVMLTAAHRTAEPLFQGSRDFSVRQRRLQLRNDPAGYAATSPRSNRISVFGIAGQNLIFDPQFGGDPIGASFSFLPLNFSGTPEEARQLLRENAGRLSVELPEDGTGTRAQLLAQPTVTSVLASFRHKVSDAVEIYLDGMFLRNVGRQEYGEPGNIVTFPDAPTNPFRQIIAFTVPRPDAGAVVRQRSDVTRLTAGAIVRLPGGWSASADYTKGSAVLERSSVTPVVNPDLFMAFLTGLPGPGGRPQVDPLRGIEDLAAALAAYRLTGFGSARLANQFSDASVRLAGSVASLPGGPLTGTLLAEQRRERVPDFKNVGRFPDLGFTRETTFFERSQTVGSAYGELRAPLTGDGGLLSNLQLQLALRYDRSVTRVPNGIGLRLTAEERPRRSGREAVTYTVGGQFRPVPAVMLRASLATGELPPSLAGLEAVAFDSVPSRGADAAAGLIDPLRGGRLVGSEGPVRVIYGGVRDSPPERARTLAMGIVFNPPGRGKPRLSVDYTRISLSREPLVVRSVVGQDQQRALAAIPALLVSGDPARLLRAPLSDADRAAGLAGGIVTQADLRGLFLGKSVVEAVDIEADWTFSAGRLGTFRSYARATWQPTLRRQLAANEPWFDAAGDTNGPLSWRGHGGIDWSRGSTSIGLNAQYFGSYAATYSDPYFESRNPQIVRFQGSERIRSQIYVDLSVQHRFSRLLELTAGVVNIFDHSPPLEGEAANRFGYSFYGDPRRRRFELTMTARR
jgi:outer membrane receptor protein involved in Fe transport